MRTFARIGSVLSLVALVMFAVDLTVSGQDQTPAPAPARGRGRRLLHHRLKPAIPPESW